MFHCCKEETHCILWSVRIKVLNSSDWFCAKGWIKHICVIHACFSKSKLTRSKHTYVSNNFITRCAAAPAQSLQRKRKPLETGTTELRRIRINLTRPDLTRWDWNDTQPGRYKLLNVTRHIMNIVLSRVGSLWTSQSGIDRQLSQLRHAACCCAQFALHQLAYQS